MAVAARKPSQRARDESLVIDGGGRIVRSSPAVTELLGWPSDALRGVSVAAVLPELPFAANTPGYNLAYAIFHATEGVWIRRTALSAAGSKVPLDVALARVNLDGEPCIVLSLRQPLFVPTPHTSRVQRDPGLSVQRALTLKPD